MIEDLFKPSRIGQMELANRFVRSATWEGLAGEDGEVTDSLIQVYRELSRGGVGLILTGYAYVSRSGKANPGMVGADGDELTRGLSLLARAAHEGGARIALQLAHGGSQSKFDTGLDAEAPSAVKERATGTMPSPLSRDGIKRVISDFADAAWRAKEAGFDAVEIHAAHGYLLAQFLSPYSNQRSDAYGGPIKKRARIIFEVLEAVREKTGSDFPIMIKINSSDFVDVGFSPEESLWVCKELSRMGIDAIELSGGIPAAGKLAPAREAITTPEKEAYFRDFAREIKPAIKCPLILVGGVRSLEVMDELYSSGVADFFSFSRPFISEPGLINRWISGDRKPARCISCNKCFAHAAAGRGLYCESFAVRRAPTEPSP